MSPSTMNITIDNSHRNLSQAWECEDLATVSKSTFAFGFEAKTHTHYTPYDPSDESKTTSTASLTSFDDSDEFTPHQDAASILPAAGTSATTATKANSTTSGEKRVRFGSLKIHEHAVEMGGSVVPRCGPGTTLAWKEESCIEIESVESYENSRTCPPRKGSEMLQPQAQRVDLLLNIGYSMNQIQLCTLECEKIRKQRNRTVNCVTFKHRTKSAMKRLLSVKSSTR